MIEKVAGAPGSPASEFLELNHTSKFMILASLRFRSSRGSPVSSNGERRDRDTRMTLTREHAREGADGQAGTRTGSHERHVYGRHRPCSYRDGWQAPGGSWGTCDAGLPA